MKNNEYRFAVSLCNGWAGGTIAIKAQNEDEAYEKAMDYVNKKLTSAFPTLQIDYNVEIENPDTCVTYSVNGNFEVSIKKNGKSLKKLEEIASDQVLREDFKELRDSVWSLIGGADYDDETKMYTFTYKVEGYYDAFINTNNNDEKTRPLAEKAIINADFGNLKDIEWKIQEIN